jgi:DNA-binding MarR family transcriptional regulator
MDFANSPRRLRTLPSWLLGQLSMEARRAVDGVLAEAGLHRSQYALLAALDEFGQLSQTALSERSGLDRSDVVRWVDDLGEQQLVERSQDPSDRRRNVISITEPGRRRLTQLDKQLAQANKELLAALPAADQRQLVSLLGRVIGVPRDDRLHAGD